MDAFTWILILALGACVLMHFFGHGHGHGRGEDAEHPAHKGKHKHEEAEDGGSRERASHAAASGHRQRRGGCH
jgi:hypothetical protein